MSPLKSPALLGGLLALSLVPVAGAAPKGKAPPAGKAGEPALAPKVVPTGKAPPACGAKLLPLNVGNEWTYEAVGARDVKTGADILPDDQIKAYVPKQPKSIVITVKSIEAPKASDKNGDTVVTLEEKYTIDLTKVKDEKPVLWDRTITTTITCNAKKFDISPDSFFFAGEPGGYFDLTFDKFERSKGTDLQLTNGTINEQAWPEDIVAHWKRTATPGSNADLGAGKLELERRFQPQPQERVNTKLGVVTTEKIGIKTTGRVTLDNTAEGLPADWTSTDKTCKATPAGLQCELPAAWSTVVDGRAPTTIWIAPGTGIIATLNPYAHMYQLADAKLK
jgi:hypothetical protein